MKRKIVSIDEEKCNGCGECISACHEGAIQLIDGKARLVSEVYCDGLGDCLGTCPQDAITIEVREAEAFDPVAVQAAHLARAGGEKAPAAVGCPGSAVRTLGPARAAGEPDSAGREMKPLGYPGERAGTGAAAQLRNWPVQLALVPPEAPWLDHVELLIAADCVPFALAEFHERLLAGRTLLIACPKLDQRLPVYVEKLEAILRAHDIRAVTVAHMEVPCCTGIVHAARTALEKAGRTDVEFHDVTVGIDGRILRES